jgi:hypothetical protein
MFEKLFILSPCSGSRLITSNIFLSEEFFFALPRAPPMHVSHLGKLPWRASFPKKENLPSEREKLTTSIFSIFLPRSLPFLRSWLAAFELLGARREEAPKYDNVNLKNIDMSKQTSSLYRVWNRRWREWFPSELPRWDINMIRGKGKPGLMREARKFSSTF